MFHIPIPINICRYIIIVIVVRHTYFLLFFLHIIMQNMIILKLYDVIRLTYIAENLIDF